MPKQLPVIWSPLSEITYSKILDFLKKEWSLKTAIEFDQKTNDLINTLSTQHKMCPQSKSAGFRRCKITPQTFLLYKIQKDHIGLVNFISNATSHSY